MKLEKVMIQGFRSIEEMTIPFGGVGHKVLVGKNECGKSNILKCLNLLSGQEEFQIGDKKQSHEGEHLVCFKFLLEDREIRKCRESFIGKFLGSTKEKLTENLTIEQFSAKHTEYILYLSKPGVDSQWTLRGLLNGEKIFKNWCYIKDNIDATELGVMFPKGSYLNKEYALPTLGSVNFQKIDPYLSEVSLEEIYRYLVGIIIDVVIPDNYSYPVINWKYNEETHDLPPYVGKEQFCTDPNSCIPLKNMFLLAGVEENDITPKITDAYASGYNHIYNLFNKVSEKANRHLGEVWNEYKSIKIELRSDGDEIVVGVRDAANSFDFEKRSDGFRRIVSFLLSVNPKINKRYADRPLILIDEPEAGLHPSSARSLRDQLINLGKENIVVYATHSISMIDTENIENNLVVTKTNENTKFEVAKEGGTSPAENVYQAIGFSIYENLNKKNILLEGYTDKKVLKHFFLKDKRWADFGICYTNGVGHIKNITSILDLGGREYFVLSDADEAVASKRKNMENLEYWYTYKNLGMDVVTLEDFYTHKFLERLVKDILKEHDVTSAVASPFSCPEIGKMGYINKFVAQNIKDQSVRGQITREIKIRAATKVSRNYAENLDEGKITATLNALFEKVNSSK